MKINHLFIEKTLISSGKIIGNSFRYCGFKKHGAICSYLRFVYIKLGFKRYYNIPQLLSPVTKYHDNNNDNNNYLVMYFYTVAKKNMFPYKPVA